MAIPTFVAMSAGIATNTAFTAPEPAGAIATDLYIELLQVTTNEAAFDETIVIPPVSWSATDPTFQQLAGNPTYGGQFAYLVRGATPDMDFTELGSQNHMIGAVYGFRGVNADVPLVLGAWHAADALVSPDQDYVVPSFDTQGDDALAVIAFFMPRNMGADWASVVGANCGAFTSRGFYSNGYGTDGHVALWTCDVASAGGTGAITVTNPADTSNWRVIHDAVTFSVESAGAGGGAGAGAGALPYYYD